MDSTIRASCRRLLSCLDGVGASPSTVQLIPIYHRGMAHRPAMFQNAKLSALRYSHDSARRLAAASRRTRDAI